MIITLKQLNEAFSKLPDTNLYHDEPYAGVYKVAALGMEVKGENPESPVPVTEIDFTMQPFINRSGSTIYRWVVDPKFKIVLMDSN